MATYRAVRTGRTLEQTVASNVSSAPSALRTSLEQLGDRGLAELRSVAPVGPTGNFRDRFDTKVEDQAVEIGNRSPHSHLVTQGRDPGKMPPPALIKALLDLPTMSEAFLVARAIGRTGTQGHDVWTEARRRLEPDVRRIARDLLRLVGGLS